MGWGPTLFFNTPEPPGTIRGDQSQLQSQLYVHMHVCIYLSMYWDYIALSLYDRLLTSRAANARMLITPRQVLACVSTPNSRALRAVQTAALPAGARHAQCARSGASWTAAACHPLAGRASSSRGR